MKDQTTVFLKDIQYFPSLWLVFAIFLFNETHETSTINEKVEKLNYIKIRNLF